MKKALVIGIGGTGQEVVNNLRELVSWRMNDGVNTQVEYIGIDTDEALRPNEYNFHHMSVNSGHVAQIENLEEQDRDWLDLRNNLSLSKGAGAVRMQGKFAFFINRQKIKDLLKRVLSRLLRVYDPEHDSVTIYIVANSVSGTGSGCFVDVGYLVREYLKGEYPRYESNIPSVLLLTLPYTLAGEDNKIRNAHFALEELNHYMSFNAYNIANITSPGSRITADSKVRPFNYAYLLGGRQTDSSTDKEINQMIADFLYCELFSEMGLAAGSPRDNMRPKMLETDGYGQYCAYSTIGISLIEYPSVQLARLSAATYVKNAIDYWNYVSDTVIDFNYNDVLLSRADNGFRTQGSIPERLISTINLESEDDEVECNLLDYIEVLKEESFKAFEEDDEFEPSVLEGLMEKIRDGFENTKDAVQINMYSKGIVRTVVKSHLAKLEFSIENSLMLQIKQRLIDFMFGRRHGIDDVLSVIDIAKSNLASIMSNEPDKTEANEIYKSLRDCIDEMNYINKEPLLALFRFRNTPMRKLKNEFNQCLENYVDCRLNRLLYDESKEFIQKLIVMLNDFSEKIRSFKVAVTDLSHNISVKIEGYQAPRRVNGHIIKSTEILNTVTRTVDGVQGRDYPYQTFINTDMKSLCVDALLNETSPHFDVTPQDVIDSQRTRFIQVFSAFTASSEFKDEQDAIARKEGTYGDPRTGDEAIADVRLLSKISLDLPEGRDKAYAYENNLMFKELFFYHGGENITQDNIDTSKDFIAHKLKDYISPHFQDKSKGISDPNIVVFLQERGAFPLRLWTVLNDQSWKSVVKAIDKQAEKMERGYIDQKGRIDVEYIPYKDLNRSQLQLAKRTFLLALVSGVLQPLSNTAFYSLKGTGVFSSPGFKIPRSYKNATFRMLRNRNSLNTVMQAVDKAMSDDMQSPDELLTRIKLLLEDNTRFALDREFNDLEQTEVMNILFRYISGDADLLKRWEEMFPKINIVVSDSSLIHISKEDEISSIFPTLGFYCSDCNARISGERSDAEDIMTQHFCQTKHT